MITIEKRAFSLKILYEDAQSLNFIIPLVLDLIHEQR